MQSSRIQEEYPLLTKEEYRRRLVGMFERMQDEAELRYWYILISEVREGLE